MEKLNRNELVNVIKSFFKDVAYFKYDLQTIIEFKRSVDFQLASKHDISKRNRFTNYDKGYVNAVYNELRDSIVNSFKHEFVRLYNNELYSTHKQTTHKTTDQLREILPCKEWDNLPSGQTWKGTTKLFFSKDGLTQELLDKV